MRICRLDSVAAAVAGNGEDPLDNEEQVADQLDAIPFLCRFQYARTAEYLLRFLDPLVAAYTEAATPGVHSWIKGHLAKFFSLLPGMAIAHVHRLAARRQAPVLQYTSALPSRSQTLACRQGRGAEAGSDGGAAHVAGSPSRCHHPRAPVVLFSRVSGMQRSPVLPIPVATKGSPCTCNVALLVSGREHHCCTRCEEDDIHVSDVNSKMLRCLR